MKRKRVVGVVGTGKGNTGPAVDAARELGVLVAAAGWAVLTGGRNEGVMKAASAGAKSKGGLVIGILPKRYPESDISPDLDVMIVSDLNNARNNLIGLSADVVVACGIDGAGTASEVALALKNKKTVILLNVQQQTIAFFQSIGRDKVIPVATAQQAIDEIKKAGLCGDCTAEPAVAPSPAT